MTLCAFKQWGELDEKLKSFLLLTSCHSHHREQPIKLERASDDVEHSWLFVPTVGAHADDHAVSKLSAFGPVTRPKLNRLAQLALLQVRDDNLVHVTLLRFRHLARVALLQARVHKLVQNLLAPSGGFEAHL